MYEHTIKFCRRITNEILINREYYDIFHQTFVGIVPLPQHSTLEVVRCKCLFTPKILSISLQLTENVPYGPACNHRLLDSTAYRVQHELHDERHEQ